MLTALLCNKFASNGKYWEHSRALLRPQFNRGQVSDISLEEDHVRAFMTVLDRHVKPDGWTSLVDLQPLFFRLTLDSATEFLFGESVNSQLVDHQPSSDDDVSFAYAFDKAQYTLAIGARLGPHFKLVHSSEFKRMVKSVHNFVDYFVQKALAEGASEKNSTDEGRYVFLKALAKDTQDPEELRSELLNILLAGRDTTASTLGFFFYTMADPRYSHIYQRLRAIILEEFGTYSNPKEITFEKMKNCQYLQWCLNECLRLYPAVPMNVRTAQVDTTLPVGGGKDGQSPIFVRKDQDIAYSVSKISHIPRSSLFCLTSPTRFFCCIAVMIYGVLMQRSSSRRGGRRGGQAGTFSHSTEDQESASVSSLH